MLKKQYGQLLLDAIRETLETMAFAEVVPYSIKIGETELIDPDELQITTNMPQIMPQSQISPPSAAPDSDSWGETPETETISTDTWGTASPVTPVMWDRPLDAWGENTPFPAPEDMGSNLKERIDFEHLIAEQEDWCWAEIKVNSAELHSIWFIVSKKLAVELARTMYAGEDFHLDNPVLRDIIAELTNVLAGRLMLLLEDMIGKFTLEVPRTGTGQPVLPDHTQFETVLCKVLVDASYPVMSSICFKKKASQNTVTLSQYATQE
ncbi:MAG: hypothetical protein FWC50_04715 [Planctomycetaceae bacterium]|nr:hypothetical protein [Planctomycetaceae bacterium]